MVRGDNTKASEVAGLGRIRRRGCLQQPSVKRAPVENAERVLFGHRVEPFYDLIIRRSDGKLFFLQSF